MGPHVSDVFQEVDDEVRREQLMKLWQRYQYLIIGAAVLLVVGVAAWRGYDYWQTKKADEAGAAYEAALELSQDGKHAEAEAAFTRIAANSNAIYRALALLHAAADLSQTDAKAAITAYDKIAADTSIDPTMRDLAALRAGALLVDSGSYADARVRLEPITGAGHTFRHTARELLALAAWRAGDTAAAKTWIGMINADPETLPDQRSRMEMLSALMGTQGKT
jgi:hypothetical protein